MNIPIQCPHCKEESILKLETVFLPPKRRREEDEETPIIMSFPCTGRRKEWHLRVKKWSEFKETYPTIDVTQVCKRALQWCRDNPFKIKSYSKMAGWLSSIWLTRELERQKQMKGEAISGKDYSQDGA